jgi:hypothetical protein
MFGGYDGAYKNDLWWYEPVSNTWIDKTTTAVSPTARTDHSMVWDSVGQRVIMFGGMDDSWSITNDLWWYEPGTNTWIDKTTTAVSPTARVNHSMVWDPEGQRVIMFGGQDDGGLKNDLWWYEPVSNTWIDKTTTAISPSVRQNYSMVWDPARSGMIMFGGQAASGDKNDLWWYEPVSNTWMQKMANGAVGSPSARTSHSMVWDSVGQRVIMFGGHDGGFKNDLWWYDPVSNAWIDKTTTAVSPTARVDHSMVWDSAGQRVIMFGGYGISPTYKNDLWWWW